MCIASATTIPESTRIPIASISENKEIKLIVFPETYRPIKATTKERGIDSPATTASLHPIVKKRTSITSMTVSKPTRVNSFKSFSTLSPASYDTTTSAPTSRFDFSDSSFSFTAFPITVISPPDFLYTFSVRALSDGFPCTDILENVLGASSPSEIKAISRR